MIECSSCLTWLHFSCAKIKRKNIPDIFICTKCTENNDASKQLPKRKMTISNTSEEDGEQEEEEKDAEGEEYEEHEEGENEAHTELSSTVSHTPAEINGNMNGSKD